jgi:hypothetical protein
MLLILLAAAGPVAAATVGHTVGDAAAGGSDVVNVAGDPAPGPYDAPPSFPGWPITISANGTFAPNDNPTFYDLDRDGDLEILVGTSTGQVYIWNHDGSAFPGWPQTCSPYCQSGPAVGDIDGDGEPEVVAFSRGPSSGGSIYAWETDGSATAGFPTSLGGNNPSESASLRDMDRDGDLDIIVGVRRYPVADLYILEGDGTPWTGWPVELDHVPSCTAATGDLDGDGQLEFAYSTYQSLYAFETDGTIMPGWPFTPGGDYRFNYSAPALCDFDGNGDMEIACPVDTLSGTGRMYVFHHNGSAAAGWPVNLNHPHAYGSPSVGDVDNDGQMEIILGDDNINAAQNTGTLYCWNFDGSNVPGWPVTVPNSWQIRGNPVVADLDGDGRLEITAGAAIMETSTSQSWLHGYDHDGTPMDDWPIRVTGWTTDNIGAAADVDGDGDADYCHLSNDNANNAYVHLWDLPGTWDRALAAWPTYHHDCWHTGETNLDVPIGVGEADFAATGVPAGVRLTWRDPARNEKVGYDLYRKAKAEDADRYGQINAAPITGLGPYRFLDEGAAAGETYSYILKATAPSGVVKSYGPVEVKAGGTRPAAFGLAVRPNPTRRNATFAFSLAGPCHATLELYDLSGRSVAVLFDGPAPAGPSEVAATLDLAPGVYVSRLEAAGETATKRVVVIR